MGRIELWFVLGTLGILGSCPVIPPTPIPVGRILATSTLTLFENRPVVLLASSRPPEAPSGLLHSAAWKVPLPSPIIPDSGTLSSDRTTWGPSRAPNQISNTSQMARIYCSQFPHDRSDFQIRALFLKLGPCPFQWFSMCGPGNTRGSPGPFQTTFIIILKCN